MQVEDDYGTTVDHSQLEFILNTHKYDVTAAMQSDRSKNLTFPTFFLVDRAANYLGSTC